MNTNLKWYRWKGLMKKEWVYQKWSVISIIAILLVLTIVDISSIYTNENLFGLPASRNTWFLLHMYMGVVLLLTSLVNEMKRPDVWFHSPATVKELIGSKLIFTTLAVMSSLLLTGAVMSVVAFNTGTTARGLLLFLGTIGVLGLNALYLMVIAFFIWSIYYALRSKVGRFSILLTFLVVMVSTIAWAIIWFTDLFQKIKEMGPLLKLSASTSNLPYLHETNFLLAGLMPDEALITVGSLGMYIVISYGLFSAGAVLLEKKVRF